MEELRELMELLGMEATNDEMNNMVAEIDFTNSGEITFKDFVRVMSKKVTPDYTADEVINAFKKFATGCPPGYITQEALVHVLSSYEGKIPVEEARALVDKIEFDPKTKLISYVEYVQMMMSDSVGK